MRAWRRLALRAARRVTIARLGAVVALVGPVAMVLAGYGWEGGLLALASGLSAAILSRLKDLAEVGAWGFSAKLRQAEELAQKAAVTAEELRRLALPIARMSLGMAIGGGRWGGHDGVRRRTRALVEALLATIQATPAERSEAYVEWRAWEHIDAGNAVSQAMNRALAARVTVASVRPSEITTAGSRYIDADTLAVAPAHAWRALALRHELLTPEVETALQALEAAAQRDDRPGKHGDLPQPEPQ